MMENLFLGAIDKIEDKIEVCCPLFVFLLQSFVADSLFKNRNAPTRWPTPRFGYPTAFSSSPICVTNRIYARPPSSTKNISATSSTKSSSSSFETSKFESMGSWKQLFSTFKLCPWKTFNLKGSFGATVPSKSSPREAFIGSRKPLPPYPSSPLRSRPLPLLHHGLNPLISPPPLELRSRRLRLRHVESLPSFPRHFSSFKHTKFHQSSSFRLSPNSFIGSVAKFSIDY